MREIGQTQLTLTPRQLETLVFIAEYRRDKNYSPTQREIAIYLGVSSQTAREHVLALKSANAVCSNRWGAARDIYLSDQGRKLIGHDNGEDRDAG